MPLKPKKNSIFAIFEHFSHQIKSSLKVAKMNIFEKNFCNKSPLYMTAILCKKKLGLLGVEWPLPGLPSPLVGIGLDVIVKKLYRLLEKQILHHKLEKKCWIYRGVLYCVSWKIFRVIKPLKSCGSIRPAPGRNKVGMWFWKNYIIYAKKNYCIMN